mmetsp:Transcript_22039/g.33660  ORF Transcript_22039/g.33660 Transcript_22039/m.33660 type:complete len:81 (-) Transcript_22039:782-1024(-)
MKSFKQISNEIHPKNCSTNISVQSGTETAPKIFWLGKCRLNTTESTSSYVTRTFHLSTATTRLLRDGISPFRSIGPLSDG